MTGDDRDPSFDDPSHDAIRALLRDARETGPVPDDVAARLDAALAELRGATRGVETPLAEVVPMRRRVSRPRLLMAAAAVIIVGAGGGGLAITLANQSSHGPASAGAQPRDAHASERSPMAPQVNGLAPVPASPQMNSLNGQLDATAGQPVGAFTTAGFARQAAAYASTTTFSYAPSQGNAGGSGAGTSTGSGSTAGTGSGTAGGPATASPPTPATIPQASSPKASTACVTPDVPGAQIVPITLDGARATLVLHPVAHGKQLVEAWSCDGTQVLAQTTVPR